MKFWQKIFFSTLILFLIICNLSIYLVAESIYGYHVEQERQSAAMEQEYLASALSEDMTGLKDRKNLSDTVLLSLVENYNARYQKKAARLFLSYQGKVLREGTSFPTLDNRYIRITGPLKEPFNDYSLIYLHSLAAMDRQWAALDAKIRLINTVSAAGLMLVLLFLLRALVHPLERLSAAARKIAQGNYAGRLTVKGRDEVAELSGEFNHMAEEVSRRMELSRQENISKQEFIDNMSHEMRTPLATIYGYAELMKQASLQEEERQEALGEIIRESRRLLNMRDELMSLSLLRQRQAPKEAVAVRGVLEQVKKQFALSFEENHIRWEEELRADTVYVNRTLFEILLSNFLQNAIRAVRPEKEGSPGRIIRVTCTEADRQFILKVTDNGRGMTRKELLHITEPFYRTDKARSRETGGAGLGLSICRRIADNQGARMEFYSEPGKGTEVVVIFTIP